jgi:hypothetical protein
VTFCCLTASGWYRSVACFSHCLGIDYIFGSVEVVAWVAEICFLWIRSGCVLHGTALLVMVILIVAMCISGRVSRFLQKSEGFVVFSRPFLAPSRLLQVLSDPEHCFRGFESIVEAAILPSKSPLPPHLVVIVIVVVQLYHVFLRWFCFCHFVCFRCAYTTLLTRN